MGRGQFWIFIGFENSGDFAMFPYVSCVFFMFLRACIPCGPRRFKLMLLVLSGPQAEEVFSLLMMCLVWLCMKGFWFRSVVY